MSDLSTLYNKYALITGSTQGLGEATARLFAERGAAGIIVCGRNAARGQAVAKSIERASCPVHFVPADLSSVADCRKVVAAADEAFGSLHVVVNSAGVTSRGSIWDASPEVFDDIMAVNVRAPLFIMQDAVKIMQRDGVAGSIVNIGSIASYGSIPALAPYAASKAALTTLTKNVAYAVVRYRIRVNVLNIGWMDTPGEDAIQRAAHGAQDGWLEMAEAKQPFGRLLKPEEVARAIAFLASDESGMMTGAAVDFDQSVMGAGLQPIAPPLTE